MRSLVPRPCPQTTTSRSTPLPEPPLHVLPPPQQPLQPGPAAAAGGLPPPCTRARPPRGNVTNANHPLTPSLPFLPSQGPRSLLPCSDPFDLGPAAAGGGIYPPVPPPAAELSRDRELAGEVANRIVDFLYQRLCDYHAAFPG